MAPDREEVWIPGSKYKSLRVGSWLTHTQCLSADQTTGVGAEL
jgi:hypothetical protein